jgi:hypothetical protein
MEVSSWENKKKGTFCQIQLEHDGTASCIGAATSGQWLEIQWAAVDVSTLDAPVSQAFMCVSQVSENWNAFN